MPHHQSPRNQTQQQRPATPVTTKDHSLQHGAIGLAAVAAAAQQIKPKEIKRQIHPLPPCLRDQD